MNIELYEGQGCKLYIALNGDFEVYGGTTKSQFTVTREGDEYLVTIPGQVRTLCYDPRFDIFARRVSTGQEWRVESGKITLKPRHSADRADVISCVEYHITKELVESGETVDGGQMIVGIKGDSAYDIARANGYEGTEAEYTEMVTKIPEYADIASTAADNALASKQSAAISDSHATKSAENAKASEDNAAKSESNAKAHMNSAAEHATSASDSANDASQSATEAQAHKVAAENAKLDAEQAAQVAQNAQTGAEAAKTHAETAKVEAQTAEANAKASATQASTDKVAAEKAKTDAQAAQSKAEQEAIKAEASAEAAENSVELAEWALPADYQRFSHVTSFDELAECATDLKDVEVWRYPLPALTNEIGHVMDYHFPNLRKVLFCSEALNGGVWARGGRFINKSLDELRMVLPNAKQLYYFAGDVAQKGIIQKIMIYAPKATVLDAYFINSFRCPGEAWILTAAGYIGEWTVGGGNLKVLRYLGNKVKSVSLSCESKLREIHCGFPLATSINFQKAKLDKASVLRVVNSLQAYDAATMSAVPTLTLGINPALNGDEEINAALLNAQESVENGGKGWNVAVSGFTITAGTGAATIGLERLVYVKRELDANGCHIDSDGQRWRVRWGDTVLENWQVNEELGYEAYPSVEAALEEWGLTEWSPEGMCEDEIEEMEEI